MWLTLLIVYVIGGLTLTPLIVVAAVLYIYHHEDPKPRHLKPQAGPTTPTPSTINPTLKVWLNARRTFDGSPQTYLSIVRTLLDSRSGNPRRAEDSYLAVLKEHILYFYEDDAMNECAAVIDVKRCRVTVFPEAGLLDGELFAKRNALLIQEKNDDTENESDPKKHGKVYQIGPWYMFFKSVSVMEDWYLALLAVQLDSPPPYPFAAQASLLASLDALPDLIPTRWLNAILGRLFLAVKGTMAVEAWVIGRLMKKLSKVRKPGFLTNVVVRSFEAGDVAPVLSKPMLKELTSDGEASVGVDVSYMPPPGGEMRLTVSAIAMISLPNTSFSLFGKSKEKEKDGTQENKPYQVSLVLAVVVKKVVGNMLVKIKRPPSNRLWYGFTTMPQMEISIEPVVSDRQIRWGMVLSVIENKLKEIIQESVVLPYMDDVPFFDTSLLPIRGGIFHDAFIHPTTEPAATTIAGPDKATIAIQNEASSFEEPIVLSRAGSETSDAESDGGVLLGQVDGSLRKRRTWFGKKETDGNTTGVACNSESTDQPNVSHARGRLEPGLDSAVRRSQSHSHSRPASPSPSLSGLSRSAPTSVPPSPTPASPAPGSTSAAATFLQTLKSRGAVMAEKQPALKEAMRKWGVGVNWTSTLRKNDKGSTVARESGDDGDDWAADDHGDLWSGTSIRSTTTYSDVRKKVEKREQLRASQRNNSKGTMPIDIPGSSSHGIPQTATMSAISGSSGPCSPRRISPPTSGRLFPTAAKTTTELQTDTIEPASPTPSMENDTHVGQTLSQTRTEDFSSQRPAPVSTSDVLDSPPRQPIRAQPPKPATMMTIPGIHTSHRGEVMSLGSDRTQTEDLTTDRDGRSLGKTTPIQSVYRLLRSGTSATNDQDKKAQSTPMTPPQLPPRVTSSPSQSQSPSVALFQVSSTTSVVGHDPLHTPTSQHPSNNIEITPPTPSSPKVSPSTSQAPNHVVEADAALTPKAPPPLPARRLSRRSTASDSTAMANHFLDSERCTVSSSPHLNLSPPPRTATFTGRDISDEAWTPPPLPPRRIHSQSQSGDYSADGSQRT